MIRQEKDRKIERRNIVKKMKERKKERKNERNDSTGER